MASRGVVKGRDSKDELSRPVRHRKYLYRFLIICEDENTEPAYFRAFKQQIPDETIYLLEIGTGLDPLGVVQRAVKERDDLALESRKTVDEVWVVFDKDDADQNDTKIKRFEQAFSLAEAEQFKLAYSNEVFELWLLLHLEEVDPNTALPRKEIYERLQKKIGSINGHEGFEYKHGNASILKKIADLGDQAAAMKRAVALQKHHGSKAPISSNPVTFVYRLVKQLNELIAWYSYKED
ncbi:RloB family protein [Mucilaginibacter auburnensis]|uniref:RloB-like protein n=1 Tax=Mucilaginibacter auburnensis TaxID=1457233 RepID=A0A2H9VV15_9SPHI|nr:RloB family protein [Mucilaginibacter auburnensis]PJJ84651.1 RloB-like protein [Mucilaginibacter auburnensis]